MNKGIIVKALSGFYYVDIGEAVIECRARGLFRKSNDSPLVGDNVEIDVLPDGSGVVNSILPRKNSLKRPPIANIDKLFIVSAYSTPAPNTFVIDSMTAIAEDKNIEPIIVFNKCDVGSFDDIADIYKKCGFRVYVVSAATGEGIDGIREELKNSVSVFAGNTGVGKSSLLNALFSDLLLKTGDVSEKLGRGRHTTRHVQLFSSGDNGFVADTPGFSSIDIEESDLIFKENLQFAFREFSDYIGGCKFTSCTHTGERGCAISSALERGEIEASRYENYKRLYSELSKFKEWEIKGKTK
ncbi:MAG: ribosome small subunit-dependent GTPase A [Ruminococcaceae bacterium]|nr:ribosome small subunit-dependent GTPase A [Oscillospiraceae bacterium]